MKPSVLFGSENREGVEHSLVRENKKNTTRRVQCPPRRVGNKRGNNGEGSTPMSLLGSERNANREGLTPSLVHENEKTAMGRVFTSSLLGNRRKGKGVEPPPLRRCTLLVTLETKEATTTRVLNPHRCSEMKETRTGRVLNPSRFHVRCGRSCRRGEGLEKCEREGVRPSLLFQDDSVSNRITRRNKTRTFLGGGHVSLPSSSTSLFP